MRVIIRILVMPFISVLAKDSSQAALTVERLAPLILLIPAAVYGTGYLTGVSARSQVHTEIAANHRRYNKRIHREKKREMNHERNTEKKMLN